MQDSIDTAAEQTSRSAAVRRLSSYETPTPEKIAFGKRLKEAREIAGLTQAEAAVQLGYSQAVQLSLMESGQRPVTLLALMQCARLYGTTTDFLCGLVPCSDRDPVIGAQAMVAARVTAEVRVLIGKLTEVSATAVRELKPDSGRMLGLARQALMIHSWLLRVRELTPAFDEDVRGSARLVNLVDTAAELAKEHVESVERAQRALAHSPVDPAAFLPECMLSAVAGSPWHGLGPVMPLDAASLADEGAGDGLAGLDQADGA